MKRIYKANKDLQSNNDIVNFDTNHKLMINTINNQKNGINNIKIEIDDIKNKLNLNNFNNMKDKAILLDKLDELNIKYNNLNSNYNEINYYNNVGDLIINYYELKNYNNDIKEKCNIIDFLSNNKKKNDNDNNKYSTKNILLDKYYKRLTGYNINNYINTIKLCEECKIEKILNINDSSFICPYCGDSEFIIIDEDKQSKQYSPYKRLNHFREWLNQFQAKETPDIPEQVFIDIKKELVKNRIIDLSILTRDNIKIILKKLSYNIYYEHITYIINKLNNLPPPKITRDMEKIFISMFLKIQEPWEKYKFSLRKNFLSYSYTIHKFCQLLGLNHLLKYFKLFKDNEKIMKSDLIWEKICKELKWEYISSFK